MTIGQLQNDNSNPTEIRKLIFFGWLKKVTNKGITNSTGKDHKLIRYGCGFCSCSVFGVN